MDIFLICRAATVWAAIVWGVTIWTIPITHAITISITIVLVLLVIYVFMLDTHIFLILILTLRIHLCLYRIARLLLRAGQFRQSHMFLLQVLKLLHGNSQFLQVMPILILQHLYSYFKFIILFTNLFFLHPQCLSIILKLLYQCTHFLYEPLCSL